MTISNATLSILDGALGLVPSTGDQVQAKVGTCSAGTANTPVLVTSPQSAQDQFGYGPLVEAAKVALAEPGNGGVVMCKAPSSVAGTVGSSTPGGGNVGTGTYTFGGTPNDAYDLALKVVADGANIAAGTGAFQYSIDGGNDFSGTLAIPTGGVYTIPNTGVTITFANGSGTSFKTGDTATASSTAPGFSNSEMNAAIDAIAAGVNDVFFVHVVGQASSAANAVAQAAALSTKLVSLATAFHYYRGAVELPHDTDANIIAAIGTTATPRVMLVADFVLLSELDGTQRKRHAAWVVTARAGRVRAAEDLGRTRSGPLTSVRGLYRNEESTQGLDAARVTTLRTITGKTGYFVTAPQMLEAVGSDYSLLQFGRVIDVAAKVIHSKASDLLRDDMEVDLVTGAIIEDAARAIEKDITDALKAALVQNKNASKVSVVIDRSTNLITSPTINIAYRVVPRGYALQLSGTLALQNPALATA